MTNDDDEIFYSSCPCGVYYVGDDLQQQEALVLNAVVYKLESVNESNELNE